MRFRRQGPSLVVDTPAKLNLFLNVRGKRPDGYHELETLMVSIGLFDTLRFSPLPREEFPLHVTCAGSGDAADIPAGDDNLIVRAARLLARETGCQRGARIDLIKRIPAASGLGGGSSDAAATLVALNRLWDTGLTRADLHRLAAQLGSDLNFFIDSPILAICRGRGELVEPISPGRLMHFVVLRPRTGLSTAAVFREWTPQRGEASLARLLHSISRGSLSSVARNAFNALTDPAARLNPDVADCLQALRHAGAQSPQMSGSGSACFALCSHARQARAIGGRIRSLQIGPVWTVSSCS